LDSGDETDDEDKPRKSVPAWAKGSRFKAALLEQHEKITVPLLPDNKPQISLTGMWGRMDMPDLTKIFRRTGKKYNKRTSSSQWDSPIMNISVNLTEKRHSDTTDY